MIYVKGLSNDYVLKLSHPLITTIPQFTQPPFFLVLLIKMAFRVAPESVQAEERFAAGGAHQPHPQVHLAYMCTNVSKGGWWTLLAALNLAPAYSFDAPS